MIERTDRLNSVVALANLVSAEVNRYSKHWEGTPGSAHALKVAISILHGAGH